MKPVIGRLILVRHGESEGNRDRRFTTSSKVPLTELGKEQARAAALRIEHRFKPELVIASPYTRAFQTGEIIAAALSVPIEVEAGLHEQSLGQLAGQSYDVVREDPNFDQSRPWLWKPPGGESHIDVLARTAPVLDRLATRYAGREIIVVSHGGVMAALWTHVTGSWERAHIPPNAGIVLIEHSGGRYLQPGIVTD